VSNVLGHIEEPLNYPQLTELLHFCQVFVTTAAHLLKTAPQICKAASF